jgi:hypothetical protein
VLRLHDTLYLDLPSGDVLDRLRATAHRRTRPVRKITATVEALIGELAGRRIPMTPQAKKATMPTSTADIPTRSYRATGQMTGWRFDNAGQLGPRLAAASVDGVVTDRAVPHRLGRRPEPGPDRLFQQLRQPAHVVPPAGQLRRLQRGQRSGAVPRGNHTRADVFLPLARTEQVPQQPAHVAAAWVHRRNHG